MENSLNIEPKKLYTIDEVAELLRYSTQTITRDIRLGKLSAFKIGDKSYRIAGSHLLKYLDTCFMEAKH
jgi:excisionase family DNA binding protein